jgi:tetratricopeptide (TPR) repeat protein
VTRHARTTRTVVPLITLLFLACGPSPEEPPAQATTPQLLDWAAGRAAAGELDKAIIGYRRALQRDSLSVASLLGLAEIYRLQERTGPADRYRRRAFHVHYGAGLDWIVAGRPDSARTSLEAAVSIMPRHPLAHLRLGELKRDAGQVDSAIVHFEHAVEANPRFAESLIILGGAYVAADRLDDARDTFERAIAANINAIDAYLELGRLLGEQREWAAAVSHFEKALLIDPGSELALQGLDHAFSRLSGKR